MTFGSGTEQAQRQPPGAFDFGLASPARVGEGGPTPPRRRRRSGPDGSLILRVVVVAVLAIAVIGGAALVAYSRVQSSEAEVKADSAALCADLATTPGVLDQAGFGWPTDAADLPTSIASMAAYEDRWSTLARIGPPSIRADLAAIATVAGDIRTSVETSQSINRPNNLASMVSVTAQTRIPAWVAKYCD